MLAIALGVALPLHLAVRFLRLPSTVPRLFLARVARICGAVVSVHGKALTKDVFFISNHISWLDIPVLAGQTGAAFIAQAPMADWPLIGWLAKLNRTVFVSRTDRLTVSQQIATLRDALDHRQPVVLFPEGTTTDGQSLLPFKPSLFEVVMRPSRKLLVQPVLLNYGSAATDIAWIGEEGAGENAVRLLRRRGKFPVRVELLDPVDPNAFPDRKALTAEIRKRMTKALSASLGGVAIV